MQPAEIMEKSLLERMDEHLRSGDAHLPVIDQIGMRVRCVVASGDFDLRELRELFRSLWRHAVACALASASSTSQPSTWSPRPRLAAWKCRTFCSPSWKSCSRTRSSWPADSALRRPLK
jgi:hypothetical protein